MFATLYPGDTQFARALHNWPLWNAPQGVENVYTLCAGKPESDDRGNNISVKCLDTSLYRCIGRYIKVEYHYYGRGNDARSVMALNTSTNPLFALPKPCTIDTKAGWLIKKGMRSRLPFICTTKSNRVYSVCDITDTGSVIYSLDHKERRNIFKKS